PRPGHRLARRAQELAVRVPRQPRGRRALRGGRLLLPLRARARHRRRAGRGRYGAHGDGALRAPRERRRCGRRQRARFAPKRRLKRASRPVIVKSVSAVTRVPPPSSERRLTIVADAPPCPRLSVPRALSVAVWALSSALSILIVPR